MRGNWKAENSLNVFSQQASDNDQVNRADRKSRSDRKPAQASINSEQSVLHVGRKTFCALRDPSAHVDSRRRARQEIPPGVEIATCRQQHLSGIGLLVILVVFVVRVQRIIRREEEIAQSHRDDIASQS